MGAVQELSSADLARELRGPNADATVNALLGRPTDEVKQIVLGLAALVPVAKEQQQEEPVVAKEIVGHKPDAEIVTKLQSLGVDVIAANVCEQVIGRPFNPKTLLSVDDLKFVESLTPELRNLVAIVPIPGDYSAHEFGGKANAEATEQKLANVAYLDSYSQQIGSSRAGDRFVLMLREVLPDTTGISRDAAITKIPEDFEAGNPAEQYMAVALKRLESGRQDSYFKVPWARGSSPRLVVGDFYDVKAYAFAYAPDGCNDLVGLGVSRISK